jgi:2-C-methyl-D-erythritol 4-phosphate cytidylyltransferase
MKIVVIITAAGYGKRMGRPKQFIEIGGKPLLEWTISVFENTKVIDEIILVVNKEDVQKGKNFKYSKLRHVVAGGEERQISVNNGLKKIADDTEIVAIHDGARPFITVDIIERAVSEAKRSGAVVVGVPVCDTVKKVDRPTSKVKVTLNRDELWAAQTPQVFRKDLILKAYQEGADKHRVTDDAMLVEKMGQPVKMVMGSYLNKKITTPEDLEMADKLLSGRARK